MARSQVIFYCDAEFLRGIGSGARMRITSNLRAYAALGVDLRLVLFCPSASLDVVMPSIGNAVVAHEKVQSRAPSVVAKLQYRLGLPFRAATQFMFTSSRQVADAVARYSQAYPDAIHHLEGESIAAALLLRRIPRSVWSFHDMPSAVSAASATIACEREHRSLSRSEAREIRFMRRVERKMARCADLVLTISEVDCETLRSWGVRAVEPLTFSVEKDPAIVPRVGRSGRLQLLHLGRLAHLPTYRSLEFLLEQVLPKLDQRTRSQLRLIVAGTATGDDPRTKHILNLVAMHSDVVELCGYVDDLTALYQSADAQVVAAGQATGARTRVVESFAHGLPVLSTSVAAAGIRGLAPGQNILIVDQADDWAGLLSELVGSRARLTNLGRKGRETYEAEYTPRIVAARLGDAIERYLTPCSRHG